MADNGEFVNDDDLIDGGVGNDTLTGQSNILVSFSISQHVFGKSNFQPRHEISYQEFTHQDNLVFANIEEHKGTVLMDKYLI
jgi:hypothetical protein